MNRALEFLQEAERIMASLNYTRKDAIFALVQLARDEVQELLDRLGELEEVVGVVDRMTGVEGRRSDGPGVVLVAEAQALMPAQLTESQRPLRALEWRERKCLPGNGKG